MAELNRAGITLSLGHSALAYEQVVRKLDAFRTATHLFNGMRGIEGARSPGVVGAILDDHAIMAGIIPDLHHVSPALIRTAARLMPGRLYAVTDALCPAGNCGKPERFMFCDKELHIADGFCADDAGTLGGSVILNIHLDLVNSTLCVGTFNALRWHLQCFDTHITLFICPYKSKIP